ncbi:cyclic pyranopterin monophosphate synthase MoaC [Candidatus Palauibacter sp.]|uniref:cyclic pyranopterin monophosphate synthase MoaC n=1 Tax=Candidatus Palauibacter sp. TaxID=3101350 RepID=UPI003B5C134A
MDRLTHLDSAGRVRMVDVGEKPLTRRVAVAEGRIRMRRATLEAIRDGEIEKGEALAVARIAAIQGAKTASALVPLCHPIPLDAVDVELEAVKALPGYRLRVRASAEWRTGVEMEALAGVAAGLLALYDMCKAIDRGMSMGPIRLLEKRGGRSGTWTAEPEE